MKKVNNINMQFNVDINKNGNSVESIGVRIGFNYQECNGIFDNHLGEFGFNITNPANGTFDLDLVANLLQSLQKNPNSSDSLKLQTSLNPNLSQDLNKIKTFLELLTKHEECLGLVDSFYKLAERYGFMTSSAQDEDDFENNLNAYLTDKFASKTNTEVHEVYIAICKVLYTHNILSAPHPKAEANYNTSTFRADVIADIASLIQLVKNQNI